MNALQRKRTYTLFAQGILLASTATYGQQNAIPAQHTTAAMTAPPAIPAQPHDISPLLYGENIPTVKLPDAEGNSIDLNQAIAAKPTVLVIYRGGWCPYCSKQLSGLQEIAGDLAAMGYQMIAISTDSPENLKQAANQKQLSYKLLSDADLRLSRQMGIAFKAPPEYGQMLDKASGGKNADMILPVPSVFILDRKGSIHFEYINPDFRQRLNPELLKTVAQHLFAEL